MLKVGTGLRGVRAERVRSGLSKSPPAKPEVDNSRIADHANANLQGFIYFEVTVPAIQNNPQEHLAVSTKGLRLTKNAGKTGRPARAIFSFRTNL
jgi:hypothetical protein